MKKLSLYIFLGLLWCNVGFAECIKGDCNNGYGTYTYANGSKYVGEWKDGKENGQGTYTWVSGNTWLNGNKYVGNLKMKNETDKELIHLQMEQLIKVSGKIIN